MGTIIGFILIVAGILIGTVVAYTLTAFAIVLAIELVADAKLTRTPHVMGAITISAAILLAVVAFIARSYATG